MSCSPPTVLLQEGPVAEDRTKYCTLILVANNFTEEFVEVNLIKSSLSGVIFAQGTFQVNLLLLLNPATSKTSCDNVVSDRARIEVLSSEMQ